MALDIEWVRRRVPEQRIVWREITESTMLDAARLAAQGCASGTVVVAEQQLAGQGRYGRRWYSEPESGLYVSIVLRLGLPADTLPVLTLALGLATAEAIARTCDLRCDLRWPNDVLVDGRKCAGILVQIEEAAVIAGIGINVNHESFPEELAGLAISLRMASGRRHSREHLLVALLGSVNSFTRMLVEGGKKPVLRLFARTSSYVTGRRVAVHQDGAVVEGTTDGLDPSGFLLLRRDDGTRSVIMAGGVRPA